jgi:hypothetical protein
MPFSCVPFQILRLAHALISFGWKFLGCLFAIGVSSRKLLVAAAALAICAGETPAAAQSGACKPGYVWRLANPQDQVCVTPETQAQVLADNQQAAVKRASGQGDACIGGYVWREANALDHVCVAPATRQQTRSDNAASTSRVAVLSAPTSAAKTPEELVQNLVAAASKGDLEGYFANLTATKRKAIEQALIRREACR